jgi:hypothetical protein
MESPIEMVRRFCAGWSDNVRSVELAAHRRCRPPQHPAGAGHWQGGHRQHIDSFIRPGPPGIESINVGAARERRRRAGTASRPLLSRPQEHLDAATSFPAPRGKEAPPA